MFQHDTSYLIAMIVGILIILWQADLIPTGRHMFGKEKVVLTWETSAVFLDTSLQGGDWMRTVVGYWTEQTSEMQ